MTIPLGVVASRRAALPAVLVAWGGGTAPTPNSAFGATEVLDTDAVLLASSRSNSGIGDPPAPFTLLTKNVQTWKGAGLAWARYGDLDPDTVYRFSAANTSGHGTVLAAIRNANPDPARANHLYYHDAEVRHGEITPLRPSGLLVRWGFGANGTNVAMTGYDGFTADDSASWNLHSTGTTRISMSVGAFTTTGSPLNVRSYPDGAGGSGADSWAGVAAL